MWSIVRVLILAAITNSYNIKPLNKYQKIYDIDRYSYSLWTDLAMISHLEAAQEDLPSMLADITMTPPKVAERCKSSIFCDEVENYPEEYFTKIIKKKFAGLIINKHNPMAHFNSSEDIKVCDYIIEYMPVKAVSHNGKWYYVLNSRTHPILNITMATCVMPDADCNNKHVEFENYTSCEQLTMQQGLLLLYGTTLKFKKFSTNNGCYCKLI